MFPVVSSQCPYDGCAGTAVIYGHESSSGRQCGKFFRKVHFALSRSMSASGTVSDWDVDVERLREQVNL